MHKKEEQFQKDTDLAGKKNQKIEISTTKIDTQKPKEKAAPQPVVIGTMVPTQQTGDMVSEKGDIIRQGEREGERNQMMLGARRRN